MARARCARCERPLSACLCPLVAASVPVPIDNPVELWVLQHPAEAGHAKGSAVLLRLALARVHIERGECFAPPPADRRNLLLYPGPVQPAPALDDPRPQRLILLDGSWRQSRTLLRANAWLAALPRLALGPGTASRYALRRAHAPGQLSTLEAAAHALARLDPREGHYRPLLTLFDRFVAEGLRRAGRTPPTPEPDPAPGPALATTTDMPPPGHRAARLP